MLVLNPRANLSLLGKNKAATAGALRAARAPAGVRPLRGPELCAVCAHRAAPGSPPRPRLPPPVSPHAHPRCSGPARPPGSAPRGRGNGRDAVGADTRGRGSTATGHGNKVSGARCHLPGPPEDRRPHGPTPPTGSGPARAQGHGSAPPPPEVPPSAPRPDDPGGRSPHARTLRAGHGPRSAPGLNGAVALRAAAPGPCARRQTKAITKAAPGPAAPPRGRCPRRRRGGLRGGGVHPRPAPGAAPPPSGPTCTAGRGRAPGAAAAPPPPPAALCSPTPGPGLPPPPTPSRPAGPLPAAAAVSGVSLLTAARGGRAVAAAAGVRVRGAAPLRRGGTHRAEAQHSEAPGARAPGGRGEGERAGGAARARPT